MLPRLITPAIVEPVSLDDLKTHLRIDTSDDDTDLTLKLLAAREHVEDETKRALISSTWEWNLERWPRENYIRLPLGNLQQVTAFTYVDDQGSTHTWSASNYVVAGAYRPGAGCAYLAPGATWPSDPLNSGEPISIQFICGWADASSVPSKIKAAILLLGGHFYRHREAVTVGGRFASNAGQQEATPMISSPLAIAVDSLLARYVLWEF